MFTNITGDYEHTEYKTYIKKYKYVTNDPITPKPSESSIPKLTKLL